MTQFRNRRENELTKLHPDIDDPVPEYTLVSGLPSYEAALELLNKSPQSCLIVHPSVFNVFRINEKATTNEQQQQMQPITPQPQLVEVTTPLLSTMNTVQPQLQMQQAEGSTTIPSTGVVRAGRAYAVLPTYEEANSPHNMLHRTAVTLTTVNEKATNASSTEQATEKLTVLTMPTTATVATTTSSDNSETHKN